MASLRPSLIRRTALFALAFGSVSSVAGCAWLASEPDAPAAAESTVARGAAATRSTRRFLLAFDGCAGRRCGIFVARFDAARPRFLARGSQPRWSRDGSRITFRCERTPTPTAAQSANNGNDELCVVDVRTGRVRTLTRNWVSDYSSGWSPDGRWIAFASTRNDRGTYNDIFVMRPDVFVMSPEGSGVRRITRSRGGNFGPAWSPDGRLLALNSHRDGNSEIYVISPDGSDPRRLTRNPGADGFAAWVGSACSRPS